MIIAWMLVRYIVYVALAEFMVRGLHDPNTRQLLSGLFLTIVIGVVLGTAHVLITLVELEGKDEQEIRQHRKAVRELLVFVVALLTALTIAVQQTSPG